MGLLQSLGNRRRPDPEPDKPIASLEALLDKRPGSTWRTQALNQARRLYDDLRAAIPHPGLDEPYTMTLVLDNLRRAATASAEGKHRFFRSISGSDIETAWAGLHGAEEQLLDVQPVAELRRRLPGIDTALRSNLQSDDPRLATYTKRLAELQLAPDDETIDAARVEIRGFLRDSNAASDAAKANVRSARNRLSLIASMTMVLLVLTSIVHALAPGFIDLSIKGGGDAPEAWWIILVGSLGGVIGALASVWRVASAPSDDQLPTYQAMIRIPLGGAAGLGGVILIRAGFITALKAEGPLALLGYALVIGYTPDLLLKYIDRRLSNVINQARGKDDPSRPELSTPTLAATAASPLTAPAVALATGGLAGNYSVEIESNPTSGAEQPDQSAAPSAGGPPASP